MKWFNPKCPVEPRAQVWIDDSMRWFGREFGPEPLERPIVLPSFFTSTAVDVVFREVAQYMRVDPARIDLELYSGRVKAFDGMPSHGAAGHFRTRKGRAVISLEVTKTRHPNALISTIAHELGHVLLLGEGRITSARRDHEPLTDLLTVYFGLGIFSANAAFEFSSYQSGWGWEKLGYLTEPMYGYALARYALLRNESKPVWAEHLDLNPRSCMRNGLRYLRHQTSASAINPLT